MNYYKLFNLPHAVKVNQKALKASYLSIQKALHPDLQTQQTQAEGEGTKSLSEVNKAFQTLSNGLSRVVYYLKTIGFSIETVKSTAEFMEEMLHIQEQIMLAQNPIEVEKIKKQVQQQINETVESVENLCELAQYEEATQVAAKSKYLLRAMEMTEGKEGAKKATS